MENLKNYLGIKIIKACKATYGEYKNWKYGKTTFESKISDDEPGYMVIYPRVSKDESNHISWSPKLAFENAHREVIESEIDLINKEKVSDIIE